MTRLRVVDPAQELRTERVPYVRCSYRAPHRRSDDVTVTAIAATLAFISSIALLTISALIQCASLL